MKSARIIVISVQNSCTLIRYTPQAQLTLEGFQTPFSQHLDKDNRWVKLASCIPWDKLANIYYRKMNSDFGAPSLSAVWLSVL